MENLDSHQRQIYDQIDKFFEELIKKAKARQLELKKQFDEIEKKERLRLEKVKEKYNQDLNLIRQFSNGFLEFFLNFNEQHDFNSNKGNYEKFLADLEKIKEQSQRKPYYFKLPKHQPSEFKFIETDLKLIDKMGKIMDNSSAQTPLVVFNTMQFGVFEYRERTQQFTQLLVIDEENLADKMPKNFKSVFIGKESFFIAGGFDQKAGKSSKKAFTLVRGKITEIMEMYKRRQFFSMVYEPKHNQIYCIGGFSVSKGSALDNVERYSIDKKEWEQVASLNNRRINCGACMIGTNHIFVFGGRNESDVFYNSVERLNIELNLWNLLKIQLPKKLCNVIAFTFDKDNIIILGGLQKFQGGIGGGNDQRESLKKNNSDKDAEKQMPEYEIEKSVYLYNQSKEVWYQLRSLPNNHKICNAVHNGNGKFYLFLLEQNKADLPQAKIYDLKLQCPKLDRFWYYEHTRKLMDQKKSQQNTVEIFINDRRTKRDKVIDPIQKAIEDKMNNKITDLMQNPLRDLKQNVVSGKDIDNPLMTNQTISTYQPINKDRIPQVYELQEIKKVNPDDKMNEADLDLSIRDPLRMRDDIFGNLNDLRLKDNFSQLNQSSFIHDLPQLGTRRSSQAQMQLMFNQEFQGLNQSNLGPQLNQSHRQSILNNTATMRGQSTMQQYNNNFYDDPFEEEYQDYPRALNNNNQFNNYRGQQYQYRDFVDDFKNSKFFNDSDEDL
ncbi:kelch motif family protein [Stylonychia lemnae]|uniref:Kelch motif family protein n=1 Tax=Stylonychia lemnae TaxID=5949 RepID=A0A078A623_STYLE|nr:kelch motif family protein [Stylonychia lemnae]|eukprot:CDW76204.1 kelch motif family protein [Stylonychia lemnae]